MIFGTSKAIKEFVKSRDEALIDFVMNDDLTKFYEHSKKYALDIPEREDIMKAGLYKAAQVCTNIPDEVKATAFDKCIALGFSPFM